MGLQQAPVSPQSNKELIESHLFQVMVIVNIRLVFKHDSFKQMQQLEEHFSLNKSGLLQPQGPLSMSNSFSVMLLEDDQ